MLTETQTTALLAVLIVAALVTIAWAWRTRGRDGSSVNDFVRPKQRTRVRR